MEQTKEVRSNAPSDRCCTGIRGKTSPTRITGRLRRSAETGSHFAWRLERGVESAVAVHAGVRCRAGAGLHGKRLTLVFGTLAMHAIVRWAVKRAAAMPARPLVAAAAGKDRVEPARQYAEDAVHDIVR